MPHEKQLKDLSKAILKLKSESEISSFLEWILTPKELEQIPARLEIVKMLRAGASQREIAKRLGVGIATVTRGAKELKRKEKLFKKI